MARQAVLRRMEAGEFVQQVLAAVQPAAGAEGQAGDARAAGQPEVPEPSLLALFDRGTGEDRRLARVLTASAERHADRVRAVVVPAAGLQEQISRWEEARRAFDTYGFARWPVVALLRSGRLVTTFHPRRVFPDDRLQEREEAEQFEVFLTKMVYYDPAQVKVQKNVDEGTGA